LIIKPRNNNWQTFSLVDIINYLNRRLHVEVFDPFMHRSEHRATFTVAVASVQNNKYFVNKLPAAE